jgi:hypothetical protein
MPVRIRPLAAAAIVIVVMSGSTQHVRADPVTFHCTLDASCPAITIAGDPYAELGGSPSPFRGYGDPSLEYDPASGTLWLSYSWLDILINDPGPPVNFNFGVRTHLASSTDKGLTWTFEKALNDTEVVPHPDTSEDVWAIHEVSTLLRVGPADWQAMWLTYYNEFGDPPGPGTGLHYERSLASDPTGLDATPAPWIRGYGTSTAIGAAYNLSTLPQLSDCAFFTEPLLFAHEGETYLATNCVVIDGGGVRQDDQERFVLLREEVAGYSYVGDLLDYDDAVQFGGTRIEQADLSFARDGGIVLIATPILSGSEPEHLGCIAYEVTDLANAEIARDMAGDAIPIATITADDQIVGPGACTYDPASETGILMHVHEVTLDPYDVEFNVRATGVHPVTSVGVADPDGDGWTTADELYLGTDPDVGCGYTLGGDPASETWPADLAESDNINIADVLEMKPVMGGSGAAIARYDLLPSGDINIADVLAIKPDFGMTCTP